MKVPLSAWMMYAITLIFPLGFLRFFWGFHWSLNLLGVVFLIIHICAWIILFKKYLELG